MRPYSLLSVWRIFALLALAGGGQWNCGASAAETPLAYPSAVGFGRHATGGAGGKVYVISTLADSGPGSFREAATASGPRIIRFAVSGQIDLSNGEVELPGDVTIDGDGVVFTRSRLRFIGDNFIVRNVRCRTGTEMPGMDLSSRDGLTIGFNPGTTVARGIIDHCSFAWATDENLSTWRSTGVDGGPAVRDITISHCVIAECLDDAGHEKGRHSMGLLIGDGSSRVTLYANLFVTNSHRNPLVKASSEIELINNLAYNYGPNGMELGGTGTTVVAINNVYIPGPATPLPATRPAIFVDDSQGAAYFLSGNLVWSEAQWKRDWTRGPGAKHLVDQPPFSGSGIASMPADQVEAYVLAHAGAWAGTPAQRDAIDEVFIEQVRTRIGPKRPPNFPAESEAHESQISSR